MKANPKRATSGTTSGPTTTSGTTSGPTTTSGTTSEVTSNQLNVGDVTLIVEALDSSERGLQCYSCLGVAYDNGFNLTKFQLALGYRALEHFFYNCKLIQADKTFSLAVKFQSLAPLQLEQVFTAVGEFRAEQSNFRLEPQTIADYKGLYASEIYHGYTAMILQMAFSSPGLLTDISAGLEFAKEPSLLVDLYAKFSLYAARDKLELFEDLNEQIMQSELLTRTLNERIIANEKALVSGHADDDD